MIGFEWINTIFQHFWTFVDSVLTFLTSCNVLRHDMLCEDMTCYVKTCYVMLRHVMLCYDMI